MCFAKSSCYGSWNCENGSFCVERVERWKFNGSDFLPHLFHYVLYQVVLAVIRKTRLHQQGIDAFFLVLLGFFLLIMRSQRSNNEQKWHNCWSVLQPLDFTFLSNKGILNEHEHRFGYYSTFLWLFTVTRRTVLFRGQLLRFCVLQVCSSSLWLARWISSCDIHIQ